jgi:GMP synthase-like glutamine amidotransferase
MSTCLVVQHVAPEEAFTIADALLHAGIDVSTRRIFAGDSLPSDAAGLDGLVVMGGPMSAASDDGFPSRQAELQLIGEAIATGVPTLGVCLGAQLVALAAGGTVYPGAAGPEIGWSPVDLRDACHDDPLFAGLPPSLHVLQWHGDSFDLPAGAQHLMSNSTYANQGFRIGESAWGLQFHLEVTDRAVAGFLAAFASDLTGGPEAAAAIRRATSPALGALSPHRAVVFGRFAALVAARVGGETLVQPR